MNKEKTEEIVEINELVDDKLTMLLVKLDKENLKNLIIILLVKSNDYNSNNEILLKDFLKNEKWNDEVEVEKIQNKINDILNNDDKISLKHFDIFKKIKENEVKKRTYHAYENFYQQIAMGYTIIYQDKNFLSKVSEYIDNEEKKIRNHYQLTKISKNYGYKISNYDDKKRYTFYDDWVKQWKKFIEALENINNHNIKDDDIFVWKIDFKDCYNNLNIKNAFNDNELNILLKKMQSFSNLYECKECKENNVEVSEIIPYGGLIQSPFYGTILINRKIEKILQIIDDLKFDAKLLEDNRIEKYSFKILDFVAYVDDVIIFIKIKKENKDDKIKENVKCDFLKIFEKMIFEDEIIINIKINKEKNDFFFLSNDENENNFLLKKRVTSVSMIKSFELPNFLREQYQKINIQNISKNESITTKNLNKMIWTEKWNKFDFISKNQIKKELNEVDEKINDGQDHKYWNHRFFSIRKKIKNNCQKKLFYEKVIRISHNSTSRIDFLKLWIKNIEYFIIKYKFMDDIEIYKKALKNYQDELDSEIKSQFIVDNLSINKKENFIYNYIKNLQEQPIIKLIAIIRKIAKNKRFWTINNKFVFGNDIENHWGESWKSLKINLFIFIKELFNKKMFFIAYRFRTFLSISENRKEFQEWMKKINEDLDQIADLNLKLIYESDLEYFNAIKYNYLAYTNNETEKSYEDIDKLFKIRILSKMFWENSLIVNNSKDNPEYSDILLLRFIELKRIFLKFKIFISKNNLSIFELIASIYFYNIGMVLNDDSDKQYHGTIKNIYNDFYNDSQKSKGKNFLNIIFNWLGKFLKIDLEACSSISYILNSYENSLDDLPRVESKIKKTAIIFNILNLLAIYSEKNQIILKKNNKNILDETTKKELIKNYLTRRIYDYEYKNNIFSFKIDLLKINEKNFNHWNYQSIKKEIKDSLKKSLESLFELLFKDFFDEKISINIEFNEINLPYNHNDFPLLE